MWWRTVLVVAALMVTAGLMGGCGEGPSATFSSSTTPVTEAPPTTFTAATTEAPSTSPGNPLVDRIAYAKSLGGMPHKGETLYFVVGANVDTEAEAQALLTAALPSFGDMQSYFIVQQSDNFEGMEPGKWVVMESYKDYPSAENLDFGRRGFPHVYVVKATVKTDDPIPIYEDRMGL